MLCNMISYAIILHYILHYIISCRITSQALADSEAAASAVQQAPYDKGVSSEIKHKFTGFKQYTTGMINNCYKQTIRIIYNITGTRGRARAHGEQAPPGAAVRGHGREVRPPADGRLAEGARRRPGEARGVQARDGGATPGVAAGGGSRARVRGRGVHGARLRVQPGPPGGGRARHALPRGMRICVSISISISISLSLCIYIYIYILRAELARHAHARGLPLRGMYVHVCYHEYHYSISIIIL